MGKDVKNVCNYRSFERLFRQYCQDIKNHNEFAIDNIISSAIDTIDPDTASAIDSMHNNNSVISKINNGGRFTKNILKHYILPDKAIPIIKKNFKKVVEHIPHQSIELFCLSLLDAIRRVSDISQEGYEYIRRLLYRDQYDFICNAYYLLVTNIEPEIWRMKWLADNGSINAQIINCPYIRNSDFVGRDDDLKIISNNFGLSQIQNISGMIGCGKTQVALEYAYRSIRKYDYIFWINANTEESLISDYYNILSFFYGNTIISSNKYHVAANLSNIDKYTMIAHEYCDWLRKNSNWLIIFDGYDDGYSIDKYLPKSNGNGHILITSVNNRPIEGAYEYILDLIPLDESIRIINPSIDYKDKEEIERTKNFALELGNLPMALKHAYDYLYYNKSETYGSYLELLRTIGSDLFDRFHINSTHELTLHKEIAIAYKKIERDYPNAALFLNLCAYLSDGVSIELGIFEEYAKSNKCLLPRELRKALRNQLAFNELILPLKKYSLCHDVDFNANCYWSINKNAACIKINKLTLDTIRGISATNKHWMQVNDMIYRTIGAAANSQAQALHDIFNKWEKDTGASLMFRDYPYSLFRNTKNSVLHKATEEDLLKFIFNIMFFPYNSSLNEVREWVLSDGPRLLSGCLETTFGWTVCNLLYFLKRLEEKHQIIDNKKFSETINEMLDAEFRSSGNKNKGFFIESISSIIKAFSIEPNEDTNDDKSLEKFIEWTNENRKIRRVYYALDKYSSLSNILDEEITKSLAESEECKNIYYCYKYLECNTPSESPLCEPEECLNLLNDDGTYVFYDELKKKIDDRNSKINLLVLFPRKFNDLLSDIEKYVGIIRDIYLSHKESGNYNNDWFTFKIPCLTMKIRWPIAQLSDFMDMHYSIFEVLLECIRVG